MRNVLEALFHVACICLLLATFWNQLADLGLKELARSEVTSNKLLRDLVRDYDHSRMAQIICAAVIAGVALSALVSLAIG